MPHAASNRPIVLALLMLGTAASCLRQQPCARTAPHAATPAAAATTTSKLATFDHRAPVPLLPMMAWHQKREMMQHLAAIQGITAALATDNWDGVAKAATTIESSPAMQQVCQHMGAGAPGFTARGLDFHHRADAIGKAARAHDRHAVLQAVANTLQACTACHATYRQDVVDAATYQQKVAPGFAPPHSGGPHP